MGHCVVLWWNGVLLYCGFLCCVSCGLCHVVCVMCSYGVRCNDMYYVIKCHVSGPLIYCDVCCVVLCSVVLCCVLCNVYSCVLCAVYCVL